MSEPLAPSPPGLLGVERRAIARTIARWLPAFEADQPTAAAENRLRVGNLGFIQVAQKWLAVAAPFGFAAACLWSLGIVMAAIPTTIIAVLLLAMTLIRWRQARQVYPHKVHLPKR